MFGAGFRSLLDLHSLFQDYLLETFKNYNPDFLFFGHTNNIDIETLENFKSINKNLIISQWNEDPIMPSLKDSKSNVSKMLSMTEYYFPIIEKILDNYDIPLELKYLPAIESRFNPTAKSPVGARGMWQIMFNTAKEYYLKSLSINNEYTSL